MTPDIKQKLKRMLINDESYRQYPYKDTTNHTTIGIGRNLDERGISLDEALSLLDDDIIYFSTKLDHLLPFFSGLSDNRKVVLINMCFNVGLHGLLCFVCMLDALKDRDFGRAADEILASKAHEQCPERYQRLANIMRTDEF